MSVLEAAALKTQLGLSQEQYDKLRAALKHGQLPPGYKVDREIKSTGATVNEVVVNGLSMAVVSLRAALEADLRAHPLLRLQTVHYLKIGGDASYDPSEKEDKSTSILLLCYAWVAKDAGLPGNSTRSHRILAGAWCKESHETVQTMCAYFADEIDDLNANGLTITIDGVPYTCHFDFSVFGDMKWIRMCYGMGGCSSTFGCTYCLCEKDDIHRSIRDGEFGKGYDQERDKMKTITRMNQLADKAKGRREEKTARTARRDRVDDDGDGKEEKKTTRAVSVSSGKTTENQEHRPAWRIPPKCCPPEKLHMLLCISRIFERTLAAMLFKKSECKKRGKRGVANPVMELRNSDKHRNECLRTIGIDKRPIQGYTAEEWKKILEHPWRWCSLARKDPNYDNLWKTMEEFGELLEEMSKMDDEKKAEEFGRKALAWAQGFVGWCEASRQSFYLHIFAQHAWRWIGISEFASYGIEKVNSIVKQHKKRARKDKKTVSAKRSASGTLTSMISAVNAKNVLEPSSPVPPRKTRAKLVCSKCGLFGHQSNNRRCPKRLKETEDQQIQRAAKPQATPKQQLIASLSSA